MQALNKKGRPRSAELVSQRQEEILAKATSVFARHGYPRTDVQVIADEIGVGKGTVYRYFASKEELFLCTVDRCMILLNEAINVAASPVSDPIQKIVTAIDSFLEFFENNPDFVELLIQERAEFRDREKPTYEIHREKNIGPWHDLIEDLITEGKIKPIPVEQITGVISNLLYGTLFLSYYASKRRSPMKHRDSIITIILSGILSTDELTNLNRHMEVIK